MAQATESQDVINQLLNEASGDIKIQCVVCKKWKKALYKCEYAECPQANRLVCKKCGKNIHSNEGDDDDDDDDDIKIEYNHDFDVNASYIRKIQPSMQLSSQDRDSIKASAKEMRLMKCTREENKISTERNYGQLLAGFGANAIVSVQQIGRYAPNAAYFKDAGNAISLALKNGEIKNFATQIQTVVMDIGDASLEITQTCKEGAYIAAGVILACEIGYHTFRLIKGDLTLKGYAKKCATATAVAAGGAMGNIGGAAIGATIGTFLCPGIGTQIGSFLGGLLGAVFVGLQAKKSMEEIEWFNDKNDQDYRHKLVQEALIAFGFEYEDITNSDIFNEAEISSRYKMLAKKAHPDMKGGSENKFLTLTSRMTILLAIIQSSDNEKQDVVKQIKQLAITLPK